MQYERSTQQVLPHGWEKERVSINCSPSGYDYLSKRGISDPRRSIVISVGALRQLRIRQYGSAAAADMAAAAGEV